MMPLRFLSRLMVLPLWLAVSGCETADHVLTSAERVLGSKTGKTVVSIAGGKDPKQILKEHTDAYQRDPEAVLVEAIALRRLLPRGGGLMLELGAGAGRNTSRYEGFERIVLLDFSRTQLEQARARLGDSDRYIYVAADVYRLPFVDGLFDAATMIRVLHHMADAPKALQQVRDALKPDGAFILEFANQRNLKAIARYWLRLQEWNPFDAKPVEFAALNFDFHPGRVRSWLETLGFRVHRTLTVSHFRAQGLKKLVPLWLLVFMDSLLQPTGALWQYTPSVDYWSFDDFHCRRPHNKEYFNIFDLILLDCDFDAFTGLDMLIAIKSDSLSIPVIFLTHVSSEDLVIRAFRAGAREYFRKPFHMHELTETIEQILEIKRNSNERRRSLQRKIPESAHGFFKETWSDVPSGIVRSIHYIENNLCHALTIEKLSKEARISKYYFCSLFKAHLQTSPMHFILNMRLNRAKQLLGVNNLTVSMVAFESGFNDPSSFTRQFKKVT